MADKIFVDGLIAKEPNEKVRQFIKVNLSFKVAEFTAFMNTHQKNGWLNADVKVSKNGKWYAEQNTYEAPSSIPAIKEQIREKLNPNISYEEAEMLAYHRAEHNSKVSKQDDDEEMTAQEFADSIPF